jgi:predicted secreted hydrolase
MKALAVLVAAALSLPAAEFRLARPGYEYRFPRDHFAHPEFQTEWWYFTGNLSASSGRRFGFELTFFRHAVTPEPTSASPWSVRDLWMAHAALSDIEKGRFLWRERINRTGPGLAGADAEAACVWNGNWQACWTGEAIALEAVTEAFALRLRLAPRKPPVIHGRDGVSRKGAGEGRASHYISLTRLDATGSLDYAGERFELAGTAWMDHEFFTNQLEPEQTGWDWFSIQLDNGMDLMLVQIRRAGGAVDPFSHGTVVEASGGTRHLEAGDFHLEPLETWRSPATGARYPIRWRILVPSLALELEATTPLASQELAGSKALLPAYWEGAMDYRGRLNGRPVAGRGYLEMTGYDRPVRLSPPPPAPGGRAASAEPPD